MVVEPVDSWGSYTSGVTFISGFEVAESPDPLFVDAVGADYHLLPTSPCIRAGVDVGLTTDADGNTIPTGAGFDIGPYFYRPEVDAGFSPWGKCDASLPLSAQITKGHSLPIGTRKITVFPGVVSAARIAEASDE